MALQEVNEVTFGMAEETTIGSVPASATWNRLQVNGNVEYGAQVQTEAREFIDTENQRQKGTVVGLDSSFGFEGDATMDFLRQMVPIFTYSRNANRDLEFRGAAVSSTGYTLANVEDSARAKLMFSANGPTSLFYAKGYANDSNNGLKPMTQAFSSGNILRLGTVAVESSPPSGATLEIAGMRGVAGGFRLTVDANARTGTLAHASVDFRNKIYPQQIVHIGGLGPANQFDGGFGFVRVVSVDNGSFTFDNADPALETDAGGGKQVDLLFGGFVRNVPNTHRDFYRPSLSFELAYSTLGPDDNQGNPTPLYGYSVGNRPNEMTLTLEPRSRITASVSFTGTDTLNPVAASGRANGADSPIVPVRNTLVNTGDDIARLSVRDADEEGFHTDFERMSVTQSNNVTTSNALQRQGAYRVNRGTFSVSTDSVIYLTSADVLESIRNNATLRKRFIFQNEDGVFAGDIGAFTLGGGAQDLTIGQSVRISATANAFRHSSFGTTVAYSWLPVAP